MSTQNSRLLGTREVGGGMTPKPATELRRRSPLLAGEDLQEEKEDVEHIEEDRRR